MEPSTAKIEKKKKKKSDKYKSSDNYYTSGSNVFMCDGGLLYVGNPHTFDYTHPWTLDLIADGLHEGLSLLSDIDFGDILDFGGGDLGGLVDIDWPDIDFEGMGEAVGELAGGAAEFMGKI